MTIIDSSTETHRVLAERKKASYKIFDDIASTYDLLNHLLSFGIDIWWRKIMMRHLPASSTNKGLVALDLACGTGDVALALGRESKVSKVIGLDLSRSMLSIGNKKVLNRGLHKKVQLLEGDGVSIPSGDRSFDVVTLSFGIRNFSDHRASLADIHRVLRPGGRAMVMEFSLPPSRLVRAIYFFYFRRVLPFVGNLVSKHRDAYTYLNQTVEDFPYGEAFLQDMRQAGFHNVRAIPLTFGIATLYLGDRTEGQLP